MPAYLVQYGLMSNVGEFSSSEGRTFARGDAVVIRTPRGLELGSIVDASTGAGFQEGRTEEGRRLAGGLILRSLDRQDDLLRERLVRNHDAAMAACTESLAQTHPELLLLDAEVLFDGQTLLFYFLGDLTAEEELAIAADLTEVYQRASGLDEFAKTMIEGCGPDCGTTAGGGCGSSSGGCGTCSTGCGVKRAN